jgi:hypothetical protein
MNICLRAVTLWCGDHKIGKPQYVIFRAEQTHQGWRWVPWKNITEELMC